MHVSEKDLQAGGPLLLSSSRGSDIRERISLDLDLLKSRDILSFFSSSVVIIPSSSAITLGTDLRPQWLGKGVQGKFSQLSISFHFELFGGLINHRILL